MALALGVSSGMICSQGQECWKLSASLVAFGRFPRRVVAAGLCSEFLPSRTEAEVRSRRRRRCIVRANTPPPPHVHIDHPLVGNPAPNFEAEAVLNQEFVKVKLSNYAGKKFVVLFFYPLNFTFVCPSELTAFSDRYSEFQKHDCEVLAVSTDSVFSHLAWIQTDRKSGGLGDIKYPLVSDLTKAITKAYRLLLPEQVILSSDSPTPQRTKLSSGHGIGLRGLFIIDKAGLIQHSSVNSLAVGRNVDEALRLLQAVKYVEGHPDEVCPANWQPGDDGVRSSAPL